MEKEDILVQEEREEEGFGWISETEKKALTMKG